MKYKFATIDGPRSFITWDKKVTVLDIPPHKRNITFDHDGKKSSYFIKLPQMRFHSYYDDVSLIDGAATSVRFFHSVVFVDHGQYFYPAFTNIDISNLSICEPRPRALYLKSELKNDLDYYEVAVKHLDSFYSSIFTHQLTSCLHMVLQKKYSGDLINFKTYLKFFKEWSDATKRGIDFDLPLIPLNNDVATRWFAFKNRLKFRDPNEV